MVRVHVIHAGNKDGSYPRIETVHTLHSTAIGQRHETELDTQWNHNGEDIDMTTW